MQPPRQFIVIILHLSPAGKIGCASITRPTLYGMRDGTFVARGYTHTYIFIYFLSLCLARCRTKLERFRRHRHGSGLAGVAPDEAAHVHEHAALDARNLGQFLAPQSQPRGRQRQTVGKRVLGLGHRLWWRARVRRGCQRMPTESEQGDATKWLKIRRT